MPNLSITKQILGYREFGNSNGTPLIALHGWGTDSRFLEPLSYLFPERKIFILDLPGYGKSKKLERYSESIDKTAQLIANTIFSLGNNCDLLAWSFSSLPAIRLISRFRSLIRSVVFVCGSPRFPADPNWPGFKYSYILKSSYYLQEHNYNRLIKLFFMAQSISSLHSTEIKNFIQKCSKEQGDLSFTVLTNGLDFIKHEDLRTELFSQDIPALFIFGRKDKLIPAELANNFPEKTARKIAIFEKSAHMPFLTEPELFQKTLGDFWSNLE